MRFAFGSGTRVKVGLEIRAAKRITALTRCDSNGTPRTAADVRNALANTMALVHSGSMDAKTVNTLAYVATSLLRAIEVSDQESRIVAIEENQRRIERSLLPPFATGGSQPNGE
jgi:hypothetical protein